MVYFTMSRVIFEFCNENGIAQTHYFATNGSISFRYLPNRNHESFSDVKDVYVHHYLKHTIILFW